MAEIMIVPRRVPNGSGFLAPFRPSIYVAMPFLKRYTFELCFAAESFR